MEKTYEVVKNGKEIAIYYGDNPSGAVAFAVGYVRAISELGARIETAACQPIDGYRWWGKFKGSKIELSVTHEGHIVTGNDF